MSGGKMGQSQNIEKFMGDTRFVCILGGCGGGSLILRYSTTKTLEPMA